MDGSKYKPKGSAMAGASKKLAYVLLLLLAMAAAALSVVVLHKVRERRAFAVLLRERDRQLIATRILLQKEKAFNKEMKRKLEEMKATTSSLRTQKTDLKTKIKGLEATSMDLKNREKELEAALTIKNSHIREMEERAAGTNPDQMAALMELLQRKEAELEEIKVRFQDYKTTERKSVSSKSPPLTNNANLKPDNAVVEKVKAEQKSSRNTSTTTTESKNTKDRSSEEKQVKYTATSMEDNGLQDKTGDVLEDIDDIYGESHSGKAKFPSQKKKFLTNSRAGSQEELDRLGHSGNSLDQDSDRVRYNKLLEKEIDKVSDETKKEKNADGNLEKISKHISDGNKNRLKYAVEDKASAAALKPNMSVNDDESQQQNKRHKKKKTRSKKKVIDSAAIGDDGEVSKEKEVDST
ncbi:uncharacterized protein LOC102711642 [Oryza brachyantha]|uniref:Uncharacterized protein n=1 Tax=Oryza brachyantha TaxID=4533 RepID=J3MQU6_ORYBR|nr:uncharacterized protein LOC102711642 [Oryza brachyantha]